MISEGCDLDSERDVTVPFFFRFCAGTFPLCLPRDHRGRGFLIGCTNAQWQGWRPSGSGRAVRGPIGLARRDVPVLRLACVGEWMAQD
jgi:hypothetical protein